MSSRRVLITGGAGFLGSTLAITLADRHPGWQIVAADSLYRRGSELNLPRLRAAGVQFVHADVRVASDVMGLGPIDALVECSAEPSVMAAVQGASETVVHTNLLGAYHCFQLAARHGAQVIFPSTSRVYPIAALAALDIVEDNSRLRLNDVQRVPGASSAGISEAFPMGGARTLYGATKLSAELLLAEYGATYEIPTTINRFGVIAGPWQMGKIDQGIAAHWMLSYLRDERLSYIGFGGTGKQVRDLLHVADAVELLDEQLSDPDRWAGHTFNVGGGLQCSVSLRELSQLCQELTGRYVAIESQPDTRPGDVPVYLSDCTALHAHTNWRPSRTPREILADIHGWATVNQELVSDALT